MNLFCLPILIWAPRVMPHLILMVLMKENRRRYEFITQEASIPAGLFLIMLKKRKNTNYPLNYHGQRNYPFKFIYQIFYTRNYLYRTNTPNMAVQSEKKLKTSLGLAVIHLPQPNTSPVHYSLFLARALRQSATEAGGAFPGS